MKLNHKKRKHRPPVRHDSHPLGSSPHRGPPTFLGHHDTFFQSESAGDKSREPDPLSVLYIQAHEADVMHGTGSTTAAQSLEVVEYHPLPGGGVDIVQKIGSALIQWEGGANVARLSSNHSVSNTRKDADSAVWVDRYDARLLLDALPTDQPYEPRPSSPTGWSDLSSDAEDTFFFNPSEVEDFYREKRRRLLEQTREDRLKARMEEDEEDELPPDEEDIWGGSDEEPDEVQKELMRRTATHLLSSPNPAQLEMRILANHGGDRRFSFLRGRWKNAWNLSKAKARVEREKEVEKPAGLGALAGYASSDDNDSDQESNDVVPKATVAEQNPQSPEPVPDAGDDAIKEARRKRLKDWAEKRRAAKDGDQAQSGESARL